MSGLSMNHASSLSASNNNNNNFSGFTSATPQPMMTMQMNAQLQQQPQQQYQQQQSAAAPTPPQPVFGVVIPGRPVRTDFVPVDPLTGLKFTMNLSCPGDLASPLAFIREIVFFLLPGIAFPANHGALVYYQLSTTVVSAGAGAVEQQQPVVSSTGFELLGALTPNEPSAVFQTGWSEKDTVVNVSQTNIPVQVTLALSIEPMDNVQNILGNTSDNNSNHSAASLGNNNSRRLYVAQQIAYDLFNFMQSFDTGASSSSNMMVVPQNIFDRWFRRFENRFKRDPNFFLRNKNDHE
eukprot:CAMPEP_0198147694 /NCGR_PEP_ID=MMETSP1443-20131203/37314_1 /TAXON_ID=186043 /ORGANISM="Entomoneis sp., Strain CCMP2396" /LENGTH=293 /DNA_ID=CAMNT_0043812133 /DNA_START=115 /DNA_END=996 /DNA_ORIENTATION=+